MHELEKDKDSLAANPENLKVIFKEMVEMCLWGNATVRCSPHAPQTLLTSTNKDLSMLTHLSHEQIQHLQSVGKDAQAARAEFILRDDQEKVWGHLKTFAGKADSRIDFVLDNGWCHALRLHTLLPR